MSDNATYINPKGSNSTITNSQLFIIMVVLAIVIAFASSMLFTEEMYFYIYGEQMAYERIQAMIDTQKQWSWVGYIVTPLLYLFKVLFVTLTLILGVTLSGVNLGIKKLFRVALIGEFVFFLPVLIKLIWFLFIDMDYSFEDVATFAPLSLSNLVEMSAVPVWLTYPLQAINLFEVAYIIILSYSLSSLLKQGLGSGLKIVFSGYLPCLILWMLAMVFLQVNML